METFWQNNEQINEDYSNIINEIDNLLLNYWFDTFEFQEMFLENKENALNTLREEMSDTKLLPDQKEEIIKKISEYLEGKTEITDYSKMSLYVERVTQDNFSWITSTFTQETTDAILYSESIESLNQLQTIYDASPEEAKRLILNDSENFDQVLADQTLISLEKNKKASYEAYNNTLTDLEFILIENEEEYLNLINTITGDNYSDITSVLYNRIEIITFLEFEENNYKAKTLLTVLHEYDRIKGIQSAKEVNVEHIYNQISENNSQEELNKNTSTKINIEETIELIENNNNDNWEVAIFENADWTYHFNSSKWNLENITKNELISINKNPDTLENLINFYNFFKELNLEWVWEYRDELIKWIWNVNINSKDNSLEKPELVNFWNEIINIINFINFEKEGFVPLNESLWNLSAVEAELRKYSEANSILSDDKSFDSYWNDKFSRDLKQSWIVEQWYVKISKIREII